jgi:hypothetical protein
MTAVDEAKSPTEKSERLKHATDLILRIWERRSVLPGEANPLGRFREAIAFLLKFEQRNFYRPAIQTPTAQAITDEISRGSERLKLLLRLPQPRSGKDTQDAPDEAALEAFSDEERDLYEMLGSLRVRFVSTTADQGAGQKTPKETPLSLVNKMIKDLKKMQGILREPAKTPRKPRKKHS